MSTIERAIEIAARAHTGQVDKAGEPYIMHPLRVMMAQTDARCRLAAMLHDVVEDSPVTLDDLRAEGFGEDVVQAIDALTKRDGETRMDAGKRAAVNPIARRVKLADLNDNMNMSRLGTPTEKDLARLKEYEAVKELLLSAESTASNHH